MPCQMCPSVSWPRDAERGSLALAWDISVVLRVPRAQGWVSGRHLAAGGTAPLQRTKVCNSIALAATEMGEERPERNMKFYDLKINASNKCLLMFKSVWQELGYFSSTTSLPLILFTASSVNFYRWIFYRRCLQARGRWLPLGTCWFCLLYFFLFLLFDTLKILPWETLPLFFTNHPTVLLAVLSNFGNGAIQSFQETGPWALVPKRTLRRLPWVIFPHWKSGFGGVSIWFKVTSKLPACWERNGSSDSFFI